MRRGIAIGMTLALLACWVSTSRADLVINIGSTTMAQGTTTTIDVTLTSNGSPDLVDNLGFQLQITGPGDLIFSSTADYSSYLNAPNYIFQTPSGNDSDDYQTSTPGGSVSSATNYQVFTGSDSTYSGNPVSLSSSSGTILLATLTIDATAALTGTYTISLVPPTGDGTGTGGLIPGLPTSTTYFENYDWTNGSYENPVPYTSNSGTIIVTGAAVPEPGTIVMGVTAAGLLALAGIARRRSNRANRQPV